MSIFSLSRCESLEFNRKGALSSPFSVNLRRFHRLVMMHRLTSVLSFDAELAFFLNLEKLFW